MYKEITKVKSVEEFEKFFIKHSVNAFFNSDELKSVENKNKIKSLGARYLIKEAVKDFLNDEVDFKEIVIENIDNGQPKIIFSGSIKEKLNQLHINNVQISISHSRNYISTLIVIESNV